MLRRIDFCAVLVISVLACSVWAGPSVGSSPINDELLKMRYGLVNSQSVGLLNDQNNETERMPTMSDQPGQTIHKGKSPLKAFLLSLAVPGLGQYYNGSRVKPALFLGAEAVCWYLHFTWNGEGDDRTADFELFNRTHWSRDRYWAFVAQVYDGDGFPSGGHTLPSTNTQQYYEMTGKYDQFSWGWDDARLDEEGDLIQLNPDLTFDPRIPQEGSHRDVYSPRRELYEQMRFDADKMYLRATRMAYVAMVNHVVAAFEAYFSARGMRKAKLPDDSEFGKLKIRTKFKSLYSVMDTPYLAMTYRF